MPTSNVAIRRFEGGGILTINDGAAGGGSNTLTVQNIVAGSLGWERGGHEHLILMDRDAMIDVYEGQQQPCKLMLDINYTGCQHSADHYQYFAGRDTTTGKMKYFTWVVKIPSVKGGATGESLTFGKVFVPAGGVKYQSGVQFDSLKVEALFLGFEPTLATY